MASRRLMTMTEYARHSGYDPSTIYKAAKGGKLPLTRNKKVDPEVADMIFGQRTNRGGDWAKARAIHEGYKAKMAKIEYEKLAGKVIDIEVVEASMARSAELMVHDIEQFASHAEEIMAVSQAGDVRAVRAKIKELTDDLRRTMARNLRIVEAD